jgi:hypothetical protein
MDEKDHVHLAVNDGPAPSAASRGQAVGDGHSAPTQPEPPLIERHAHGVEVRCD